MPNPSRLSTLTFSATVDGTYAPLERWKSGSINLDVNTYSTSVKEDEFETKDYGRASGTISAECQAEESTAAPVQALIEDAAHNKTKIFARYRKATATGRGEKTVEVLVTKISEDNPDEDSIMLSLEFDISGAPTRGVQT